MSAHSAIPKSVNRLGILGLIILVIACLYQWSLGDIFNIPNLDSTRNLISATTTGEISEDEPGTYYKIEKIIDGDTFVINIHGMNEKVRLLGINTPEIVDPYKLKQCYGKEASDRMEEIALGKLVQLKYDYSQGTRDIYNRLLVYAYLEDGQMLNRKLIAEGYAYEYTYMKPYIYQSEFRALQNLAHLSGRGLWSKDTCNGSSDFPQ